MNFCSPKTPSSSLNHIWLSVHPTTDPTVMPGFLSATGPKSWCASRGERTRHRSSSGGVNRPNVLSGTLWLPVVTKCAPTSGSPILSGFEVTKQNVSLKT